MTPERPVTGELDSTVRGNLFISDATEDVAFVKCLRKGLGHWLSSVVGSVVRGPEPLERLFRNNLSGHSACSIPAGMVAQIERNTQAGVHQTPVAGRLH